MGYDSNECLFCHIAGNGNVTADEEDLTNICFQCIGQVFNHPNTKKSKRYLEHISRSVRLHGTCIYCGNGSDKEMGYYEYSFTKPEYNNATLICLINLCEYHKNKELQTYLKEMDDKNSIENIFDEIQKTLEGRLSNEKAKELIENLKEQFK